MTKTLRNIALTTVLTAGGLLAQNAQTPNQPKKSNYCKSIESMNRKFGGFLGSNPCPPGMPDPNPNHVPILPGSFMGRPAPKTQTLIPRIKITFKDGRIAEYDYQGTCFQKSPNEKWSHLMLMVRDNGKDTLIDTAVVRTYHSFTLTQ